MKKSKNILMLFIFLGTLFFHMDAYASPDTIAQNDFDYKWYLEKHPDLAMAIDANDKDAIYNFYINVGIPAGWQGRKAKHAYLSKQNFDYDRFTTDHPDVLAAFGNDKELIWNFYITLGEDSGYKAYTANNVEVNAILDTYDIVESITAGCSTDREKVKAVHDWIINRTSYDYDNYLNNTIPSSSYCIQGVIFNKTAVCDGYARTFEQFMDLLGISCYKVVSPSHAWNRVKVDGTWYSIDTTWDDPIYRYNGVRQEILKYDYFLISEEQMNLVRSHQPEQSSVLAKEKYEK